MAGLDVVYVNYNSTALLLDSISSLEQAAKNVVELQKVVVFDNASRPEEQDGLAALGRHVDVVKSPVNVGFATGCNRGAERGSAPSLLFLNPDTLVQDDMLAALLATLGEHSGRALVGPRHYVDPRRELSISPLRGTSLGGRMTDTLYARGYLGEASLRLLRQRVAIWDRAQPELVRAVSGAAMVMGREVFRDLAGFDERFFLYVEDTDLCVRARRRGIPVLYVPGASLVHFVEQSGSGDIGSARENMSAGIRTFERKHHSPLARAGVQLGVRAAGLLPQRSRRFEAPVSDPSETFERPAGRRWVVEVGRSLLFDNCLTAFPVGADYVFPPEVWGRLARGEYFARSAVEGDDGSWREVRLCRWLRTP